MKFIKKEYGNGRVKSYLAFNTGKVVRMNPVETVEFENKIREWQHRENPSDLVDQ